MKVGSLGAQQPLPKIDRMVNKIADKIIIEDWIQGSYIDEDDYEEIENWHDLLEQLNMTASEARQTIIESLNDDSWGWILNRNSGLYTADDMELTFDDDGVFDAGDGRFMKYGEVMKLVKQRLVEKGIMQKAN